MSRRYTVLLVAAAWVLGGGLPLGRGPRSTTAQESEETRSLTVEVINAEARPVPTRAQGTTLIEGTVAVNGIVGVEGDVGIEGTVPVEGVVEVKGPVTVRGAVELGSDVMVGLRPSANGVRVLNHGDDPLPIVNVNEARTPFQKSASLSFAPGSRRATASLVLPVGKRLVIEHVSARAALASGQRLVETRIATQQAARGSSTAHYLVAVEQGSREGGMNHFAISQSVRLYAMQAILVSAERTEDTGTGKLAFSISGYLVTP